MLHSARKKILATVLQPASVLSQMTYLSIKCVKTAVAKVLFITIQQLHDCKDNDVILSTIHVQINTRTYNINTNTNRQLPSMCYS